MAHRHLLICDGCGQEANVNDAGTRLPPDWFLNFKVALGNVGRIHDLCATCHKQLMTVSDVSKWTKPSGRLANGA